MSGHIQDVSAVGGLRISVQTSIPQQSLSNERAEIAILTRRFRALGVAHPLIESRQDDGPQIELPGFYDERAARQAIEEPGRLEFRIVPELDKDWTTRPQLIDDVQTGYEQICDSHGQPIPVRVLEQRVFSKPPAISGELLLPNTHVETAGARTHIMYEFRDDAKQEFEIITRARRGKRLAIFLDRKLIIAPTINDTIPGKGIIDCQFTTGEALALSAKLTTGVLHTPWKVVSVQVVQKPGH